MHDHRRPADQEPRSPGGLRILMINPNTTDALTQRLAGVARACVGATHEILPRTAPRGFPYVSSRAEAQIAGTIVLEMIAAETAAYDAVVVAAYGDPGLRAAREMLDVPVVGMAEAAMLTACMLGDRFSVVTFSDRLTSWFHEGVVAARLESRLASIRALTAAPPALSDVAELLREPLQELCRRAAEEDRADVVILAGAPLAGLAQRIGADLPLMALDPISAAVAQACALATVAPAGATAGGFKRPPRKESVGLAPPLARWLGGDDLRIELLRPLD
jgi:allantoin racemase